MKAFLRALLSAIALLLGACQEGDGPSGTQGSVWPPSGPPASRPGLLYGYYGSVNDQVAETKDHVTLQWVTVWDRKLGNGIDAVKARLREAREANIPAVILDVPGAYVSEESVRAYFAELHAEGLIDARIVALYPEDEPDLRRTEEQVVATNAMLRRVAAEFPFVDVKLAAIYTGRGLWTGIGSYDWVGFDDYPQKSKVLTNATWVDLQDRLQSWQRIILVPGAAWCDNVWDFYAKAQEDPHVIAIVPFIWFDGWDINDPNSLGLRSQACRQQYIDAALRIKNPR